jgi:hypothetical protein
VAGCRHDAVRGEKNIGFEGAPRLPSSTTAKRKKKTEGRVVMARR